MKIKQNYVNIKQKNIPQKTDLNEVYALIKRVTTDKYASAVILELQEEYDGFDCYEVCDKDGKILIRASNGVGFAAGFNTYLKERCGYSIGALSTCGTLPENPPAVGQSLFGKSKFLYRYFYNYCTFCYTYAFDTWEDWEKTLDYLLLSGYNLILNPVGLETVWRETLLALDYTEEEIRNFLCGPAFYAWQWMMNMTGWAGGAPNWWYEERKALAGKINLRMQAFGASTVAGGYAGMVPADFSEHFPDSKPIDQGPWCGFVRPSLIMPEDPNFDRVASIFYSECKKIPGADAVHYYSVDPFHEGGRTEEIDLFDYSTRVYNTMLKMDLDAVWMFQGWTASPKPEMLTAIPDGRAIVTALSAKADCKARIYSGAPWIYCAVYCYGGQYNFSGNVEGVLEGSFNALDRDDTNVIGMGYMPESVNCNEIIYEIYSRNTFGSKSNLESFIPYYLNTRYGFCDDKLADVWTRFSKEVLNGTTLKSGESALCARPSLTVKNTSYWGNKPNPFVDQSIIIEYISVMLQYYDRLKESAGYRKDLMEATRQAISNLSWYYAHMIPVAYESKDIDALSYYGKEMLSLIDIQEAVVATDPDMLLGKWLEKAKRHGKTPAEKAYFEWNARVQITLWANREGAKLLRDYAAKEWQGLLSDFYRPRWESFITRLELSLFTKTPLEAINNYDEELPFVYRKNQYPTEPIGDLRTAVSAALEKLCATKIVYKEETEAQPDFETNVAQTFS